MSLTDLPTESEAVLLLKPEDKLKHYQEGRTDVRSYAGFLIQVVTLLLTTMILVLGWIAKDYATEQYHLAQQTVNLTSLPVALQTSQAAPSDTTLPSKQEQAETKTVLPETQGDTLIEERLDKISEHYRHILLYSLTSSLILDGFSYFMLVVLGMLIMLCYQLQRRRYHYHSVGLDLGFQPDQPVVDNRLIARALSHFMGSLTFIVCCLIAVTIYQNWRYFWFTGSVGGKILIVAGLVIILHKAWTVGDLLWNYRKFEKREGWHARWRRAEVIVIGLQQNLASKFPQDGELMQGLEKLKEICKTGGKEGWKESEEVLRGLAPLVAPPELAPSFKEAVSDIIVTLHHTKSLREFVYT